MSASSTGTVAGATGMTASRCSEFGNTVSNNTFENNDDWNICVVSGNTDGGGNREAPITFDCP